MPSHIGIWSLKLGCRTLARDVDSSMIDIDPLPHCISAARSCINAAELVRELVPPSHHLAFCVHYLTLSGLTLWVDQYRLPIPPAEANWSELGC